ncbi:hypothetical protein Zm00014a_028853 [Zea mays]|uniref:Uncharacterized protein n=1 Tax=Zea mays TaxID=4577 RepID=A0A317YCY4_MAIZE|nr:hypothetical protein Zm00014a_028853 [Zea mays]
MRRHLCRLPDLAQPVVDALKLREHPRGAVAVPRRGRRNVRVQEPLHERQEPRPCLVPEPPRKLAPLLRAASPLPFRRRHCCRRRSGGGGGGGRGTSFQPPLRRGQPRLRGRHCLRRRRLG